MKYIFRLLILIISTIECEVPTAVVFDLNGVVFHVQRSGTIAFIMSALGPVNSLRFIATTTTTDWHKEFFEILTKVPCSDLTIAHYGDNPPLGQGLPMPPIMIAWQEGKLPSNEILERVHNYITTTEELSDFEKLVFSAIAQIAFDPKIRTGITCEDSEVTTIIRELRDNNISVYALTNQDPQNLEELKKKFPETFAHFVGVVASCDPDIHTCKPHPAIYQHLNLPPTKTAFVDDQEENTTAAKQLGMQVVHHQRAPDTRRKLSELGLPVRPT